MSRLLHAAPQARQPTYGWLIACDDARVTAHLGVAELSHSYAYAKKALNELIDWHIAVATDPAVNGGFSLQARQPLNEISISAAWAKVMHGTTGPLPLIEFARAIEAAHNIKEGT